MAIAVRNGLQDGLAAEAVEDIDPILGICADNYKPGLFCGSGWPGIADVLVTDLLPDLADDRGDDLVNRRLADGMREAAYVIAPSLAALAGAAVAEHQSHEELVGAVKRLRDQARPRVEHIRRWLAGEGYLH